MIFYLLGLQMAVKGKVSYNSSLLIISSIVFFAIQLYEAYFIGVGIKVSSWIWASSFILLLMGPICKLLENSKKFNYLFSYIGRYSFGIYLSHVYVLDLYNSLNISVPWLFRIFIILLFSISLVKILEFLIPSNVVKYFGLK